ncbi:hypothetical protein D1631_06240 [Chryseobacterium nematophagum]|uniref:Uncharacterized protein n=1 Tax=Chryseobacterium nematophagum TaxID=2305228 RepID=A0A3M7TEZ7_9FLAO|nr:hypothetical protein [Chryseobacterium nematophagum]RNA61556.1 hypothetical protein D1631_06240 [Chryseobacterium nematophagum]
MITNLRDKIRFTFLFYRYFLILTSFVVKKIITIIILGIYSFIFSQVGINTVNPQGILHVDASKDNPIIGIPNAIQQNNDVIVTSTGQVGVGTIAPSSKLELNSGVNNSSGMKFTNLTSSTPVSAGATLGVDASGNVITVQGSSFSPFFGRSVLGSTVNIPANTTNYNLLNFTLPTAGTYLITYSIRGEIQVTGGYGYLVTFLSTLPSVGNMIPDTEVLIVTSNDSNRSVIGGTGTGSLIRTVNGPTTFYVGLRSTNLSGIVFNNGDGRTSVSYVKVTP